MTSAPGALAWLLPLFLLGGCWDFDALHAGYGELPDARRKVPDGMEAEDLGTPGCLPDCSDCPDMGCESQMTFFGYGELVTDAMGCPQGEVANGQALYDKQDVKMTCSGCSCGAPGKCTSKVGFYKTSDSTCKAGDLSKAYDLPGATDCTKVATGGPNYRLEDPQLQCAADGAGAKVDVGWTKKGQLCLVTGADMGCKTPSCVADKMVPGKKLCFAVSGKNGVCPASFPVKSEWYGIADSRTCSCACGTPMNTTCDGAVSLFDDDNCMMNSKATMSNACGATPNMAKSVQYKWVPKAGAQCSPAGTPTGAAPVVSPLTVCCQQ